MFAKISVASFAIGPPSLSAGFLLRVWVLSDPLILVPEHDGMGRFRLMASAMRRALYNRCSAAVLRQFCARHGNR